MLVIAILLVVAGLVGVAMGMKRLGTTKRAMAGAALGALAESGW
jgi:uncharacterized protein YqgC (DUF456 family)